MQNLIVYHFVSGHAWFSCGLLICAIIVPDYLGCFQQRGWLKRAARVLLFVLPVFAALSTTPMPLWLALPLISTYLGYTAFGFAHPNERRRRWLGGLAAILVVSALALELPWHLTAFPAKARPRSLYVLADSVTAGVGREKSTWPKILTSRTGIKIFDFSLAGATVQSAVLGQIPRMQKQDNPESWVLVELGGNDLFGGTPASQFHEYLEQLLLAARGAPDHPRTMLMFELPLLPGCWSYGRSQRILASKYNVILIPKRFFAGLLLTQGNTLDGIHLSAAGHENMAKLLLPWLGQE